jgi:hypothetical protein
MSNCTSCGAPYPAGATFCAHCGGKIQAAPPPSSFGAPAAGSHFLGTPMRVCPGCGVIAPTQRTTCAVCNTGYGATPPMVPPMPEGRYWGAILEADFACRGCGQRSPLDGLNIDGQATCRKCNLRQPFDAEQWGEALALTQNVADLAGPPGRRPDWDGNPFLAIGVTDTWDEGKSEGLLIDSEGVKPRTLRVRASLGHPLCSKCKAPIDIALDGHGRAQTTCPRCHDQAVYALPADYDDQNVDLLAVISDEHRADRPAMPGSGTAPKPIWCLFEDDGPLRSGVGDDDDDDEDDDDDDDEHHHHDHPGDKAAYLREAQAAHARAQVAPVPQKTSGSSVVGVIAIGVGVLAVVGVIALVAMRQRSPVPSEPEAKQEEAPEKKSKKKSVAAEEPEAEKKALPAVAIDKSKFKRLDGCSCKASTGGKGASDVMQLMVHLDSEDKLKGSETTRFAASWTIDIPGQSPYLLTLEGDGAQAPPREVLGRGVSVGVACTKDAFIVVSGDRADGWSTTSQKHLWGTKLSANYGAVAKPSEGALNIQCDVVPVAGKLLRVPLAGGKSQAVDLATGK